MPTIGPRVEKSCSRPGMIMFLTIVERNALQQFVHLQHWAAGLVTITGPGKKTLQSHYNNDSNSGQERRNLCGPPPLVALSFSHFQLDFQAVFITHLSLPFKIIISLFYCSHTLTHDDTFHQCLAVSRLYSSISYMPYRRGRLKVKNKNIMGLLTALNGATAAKHNTLEHVNVFCPGQGVEWGGLGGQSELHACQPALRTALFTFQKLNWGCQDADEPPHSGCCHPVWKTF